MNEPVELKHIIHITYGDIRQRIVLSNEIYSIGRHSSNKIVIHHPTISRFHCTILPVKYKGENQQTLFWIIDGDLKGNRSSNGIFINGNKSLSHELISGDFIKIGGNEVEVFYEIFNEENGDYLSISEANISSTNLSNIVINPKYSKVSSSQTTVTEENQEQEEKFIREILFTFHHNHNHIKAPYIHINKEGKIIHFNSFFKEVFPDFNRNSYPNPFVDNLQGIVKSSSNNFCIREIKHQNKYYTQYAYYQQEQDIIESYIFCFEDRYTLEKNLQENEEKYRAVVRQISEGIILVDPISKQIIEANQAYCSLIGYSNEEILTLKIYDVLATDPEVHDSIIRKVQKNRLNLVQESIHRHRNRHFIDVEANISSIYYGAKEYICYAVRDITERKMAQEMLCYQACHDLLTQLGNRNLFNEQLYKAIARSQRYKSRLAVIFIDLDRFKYINDTLGHDIGDRFLQEVAIKIKNCLRSADIIARWGGDEFTILLSEIKNPQDATIVAKRIFNSLKQPIIISEYQLYCHLSMGIAIYPQDGENPENLLKNADIALYRSKDSGGNQYQYYNPSMNKRNTELLHLETNLYQAIRESQLCLYYQPQININTGKVTGMEALIRWQHPDLGMVSPEQFIPIAEETGFINSIGEWVLFTACKQNKKWQQSGLAPLKIAVNLSPRQCQPNLVTSLKQILKETKLEPEYLELEITETSIIVHPELTKEILEELTEIGISITMDDFGSGYSSVGYLKKFPFQKIKIDQSFVRDLKNEPSELAIISAVITLGKGFNLQVVAEGVENQEQAYLLKNLQCDTMQGYFFSYPLPVDDATKFIQSVANEGIFLP
ncbi:EAL domain-containing protein [Cyanobacterium sp. DS4]|uniref:EAL domain-containing protein n=1 Tax=Cyanobacterium sp. DS4 TaxID=2878255 RepID=UPI002E7FD225|nr:EAL domain-containing protein [Cyanobacterium sp. Dongsha4]WVK99148.1 EAL domain-containing protein [Cyanobacterium sp. Dongsha4]